MNEKLLILAHRQGFRTLSEVAIKMGKSPAAFFNNLTYFSRTKNFKSKFATSLQEVLNVSEAQMRKALLIENLNTTESLENSLGHFYKLFLFLTLGTHKAERIYHISFSSQPKYHLEFSRDVVISAVINGRRFINIYEENNSKFNKTFILNQERETLHLYLYAFYNYCEGHSIKVKDKFQDNHVIELLSLCIQPVFVDIGGLASVHSYIITDSETPVVFEDITSGERISQYDYVPEIYVPRVLAETSKIIKRASKNLKSAKTLSKEAKELATTIGLELSKS